MSTPRFLAVGLFGGVALGVAARAWMRLISDDPEFSWNGSIAIVTLFTIFGITQSFAAAARHARRRRTLSFARIVGTVGILTIFMGPGALMAPTVAGAGFARVRKEWPRFVRTLCLVVAAVPVVVVSSDLRDKFGWTLHTAAGVAAMLAVYGVIACAAGFTMATAPGGWRFNRYLKLAVCAIAGIALVLLAAGTVFT